jgi:hypothetical protein
MPRIRVLKAYGFRGIGSGGVELNFARGGQAVSMMLHGTNGTGKSSVTDAWEWLWSGEIGHLGREGAGPRSFPHKLAGENGTYVELELDDDSQPIRLEFRPDRVASPRSQGDLAGFREATPHPCHLRYRDLVEFMYKTKSEKYSALARLMGFERAVETQRGLKRALRVVEEKREQAARAVAEIEAIFREQGMPVPRDSAEYLDGLGPVLRRQGLEAATSLAEVAERVTQMEEMVAEHPEAVELSQARTARQMAQRLSELEDVRGELADFCECVEDLHAREACAEDVLSLDLYRVGEAVMATTGRVDVCPLCDQGFDGDLVTHVAEKRAALAGVEEAQANARAARAGLLEKLRGQQVRLSDGARDLADQDDVEEKLGAVGGAIKGGAEWIARWYGYMSADIADMKAEGRPDCDCDAYGLIAEGAATTAASLGTRIDELEASEGRRRLVSDHAMVKDTLNGWRRLRTERARVKSLEDGLQAFSDIVEGFDTAVREQVMCEFEEISDDVATCFRELERGSEVLGRPEIRLSTDADRAVVLSVEFAGEEVTPAFAVLSESQLASFGLAVFLACARRFNVKLPFVLLDDIISSFDAYKRQALVDVLKFDCADLQMLVLTHDSVWFERLQRALPSWKRNRITGWDLVSGPRLDVAPSSWEKVVNAVANDDGEVAGCLLGPYLEKELQALCEAAEAELKYNRQNKFTLNELLVGFRARMKKKLGAEHEVVKALQEFEEMEVFRNYCAHYKDPESPYTAAEVGEIADRWWSVETALRCETCGEYARWAEDKFVCRCGALSLTRC